LLFSLFSSVILSFSQITVKADIDGTKAFFVTLALYRTKVAVSGNGFGLLIENLPLTDSPGCACVERIEKGWSFKELQPL